MSGLPWPVAQQAIRRGLVQALSPRRRAGEQRVKRWGEAKAQSLEAGQALADEILECAGLEDGAERRLEFVQRAPVASPRPGRLGQALLGGGDQGFRSGSELVANRGDQGGGLIHGYSSPKTALSFWRSTARVNGLMM